MVVFKRESAVRLILCLTVYIILLLNCFNFTDAAVILSPSPRAFVCNAGDKLVVICNTTKHSQQWKLALRGPGVMNPINTISISSNTAFEKRIMINSSTVTISRISERDEAPLISRLEIRVFLNGTLNITCMELGASGMAATTTPYITGIQDHQGYHPMTPELVIFAEAFKMDKVTISLQWMQEVYQEWFVSYNIIILPQLNSMADVVTMINSVRANLTLLYNTLYNVSVVADLCGQRNSTTLSEIYYAKCEAPLKMHHGSVIISNGNTPLLKGSVLGYSCPPGLVLIGPNTTTCMENGEWESDPTEVNCTNTTTSINQCSDSDSSLGAANLNCSGQNYTQTDTTGDQNLVGLVLGVLVGSGTILIVVVLIAVFLIGRKKVKLKGIVQLWKKGTSQDPDHDHSRNQVVDTLVEHMHPVYADIGPSSLNTKIVGVFEVDDTRVDYALINHNLPRKETKHSDSEVNKQPDNIPSVDLDKLLFQLRPQVGAKWYRFGEAAGISKDILDNYAEYCKPEDCIVEMLDCWLRNYDAGKLTWKDVASVLRAIDLGRLADDIENVYSTGRLPIEVDINEMPNLVLAESRESAQYDQEHELPPSIPPKTTTQLSMQEDLPPNIIIFCVNSSSNNVPPKP